MERAKIKKQARELNSGYTWQLLFSVFIVKGFLNFVAVLSILSGVVNLALSKFAPDFVFMAPGKELFLMLIGLAIALFVVPLSCTVDGMFVRFVRLGRTTVGDSVGFCLRVFCKQFIKLLWVNFIVQLIIVLWSFLLVFPGMIATYRYRFINHVVLDNSKLSSRKARKICREVTRGGKTKCFVLDLSFILWKIFATLLLGLPKIYLIPYIGTTNALYYENLKITAIQEGRVEAIELNCAVVTNYQPQHMVQQPPEVIVATESENEVVTNAVSLA